MDVLECAPTIFLSVPPGNDEIVTRVKMVPPLRFHHVPVEAVSRLDLAKDDVPLCDVLGPRDGFVGGFVFGRDKRIQRPTRASETNCFPIDEMFLDHHVPKVPEPQFFLPILGENGQGDVDVQGWMNLVMSVERENSF